MSSAFNLAGWLCFLLAVKNFLGIGAGGTVQDAEMAMLGEILPIPDFKTIIFAAAAVLLGFLAKQSGKEGEAARGGKVMLCGVLCIVLTFTPLSSISVFSSIMSYQKEQQTSDGLEPLPEEDYTLYAFLGSGDSLPADVDIMEYIMNDYDGHAKDTYETYKIAGWLFQENGAEWSEEYFTFRLVDKEGNDILSDGEPVLLHYSAKDEDCRPEGSGGFQTNTVKAEDLSGIPYGFRVESAQKAYFIDQRDGSKHDSPIYN